MHPSSRDSRVLLLAVLVFAVLCVGGASAPAQDAPAEAAGHRRASSPTCGASQSSLSATIAEQNTAIDSMIGEVSALRQRQAAVEAELAEKQAELSRATAELARNGVTCSGCALSCSRALGVLRAAAGRDL